MNVALIGFMAAGKSTVGRVLADRLGCRVVDTDEEIVRRTGMDVAELFSSEGEASFRAMERLVVADASALKKAVIACGGGVILDRGNVDTLRGSSTLVLLTASVEEILGRVKGDGSRPLLNVEDREYSVAARLQERAPLYLAAADAVVDTTSLTPEQAAYRVLQILGDKV